MTVFGRRIFPVGGRQGTILAWWGLRPVTGVRRRHRCTHRRPCGGGAAIGLTVSPLKTVTICQKAGGTEGVSPGAS